jgi:hypothetical protein
LLAKSSRGVPPTSATDVASVAANARAILDAQANQARDAGTELVFDKSRKVGQQVDYSGFDNQSLAVVALNQDASFSVEESRTAKSELDARNRASILSAFNTSQNGGGLQSAGLALLQQYSSMSDAERTVLGFTDAYKNQVMQNYRTISSYQNIGGSAATSSVLGAASYL